MATAGAEGGGHPSVADLPPTEPRLSASGASRRFAVSWAAGDISSGGEDEGTRIGAALRERDAPRLGLDAAGGRLTLTWGAPTPSEGQQLAPLWTADRSLAP